MISSDLIDDATNKIIIIRERLQAIQDRQKYYDAKQRFVIFNVGDFIFNKIIPMKGIQHFGKTGYLSPYYIGPSKIVKRIGNVAYRLALPANIYFVYNVLHISSLRKFISDDLSKIITETIDIQLDLTYVEESDHILEYSVKQLRSRDIPFVKVLWKHGSERHPTREKESEISKCYPHLFD
ncbi:uncharacterized protein LOC110098375 [Dendrobium catenatum]|uniref:uncharacterized protein LOC110098375 n=1 Tax=Dendrobium catenatum TaxID=906689 RepID=UPI0010A0B59B|nr:uncharacterized protein LOC110098375 [Dendrobium catenatum]